MGLGTIARVILGTIIGVIVFPFMFAAFLILYVIEVLEEAAKK